MRGRKGDGREWARARTKKIVVGMYSFSCTVIIVFMYSFKLYGYYCFLSSCTVINSIHVFILVLQVVQNPIEHDPNRVRRFEASIARAN